MSLEASRRGERRYYGESRQLAMVISDENLRRIVVLRTVGERRRDELCVKYQWARGGGTMHYEKLCVKYWWGRLQLRLDVSAARRTCGQLWTRKKVCGDVLSSC